MATFLSRSPFETAPGLNPLGAFNWIAWALVIGGALSWSVLGLFGIDALGSLLQIAPALGAWVSLVVGVAGLYFLCVPFQTRFDEDKGARHLVSTSMPTAAGQVRGQVATMLWGWTLIALGVAGVVGLLALLEWFFP